MKFKHLILAGTFDHFHLGHKQFIKNAVQSAHFVSCGINLSQKNKILRQTIQSYKTRAKSLKKFLLSCQLSQKINFFPLNNPCEPAASDPEFDGLAATKESLRGAKLVNQQRKLKNLKPLSILLSDLVMAGDKKRLSSTRIRLGQINRQGLVYHTLLPKNKTLYLPLKNRRYFQNPFGTLLTGSNTHLAWAGLKAQKRLRKFKSPLIISVGDIATQVLLSRQIPVSLAIFDNRCQRKSLPVNLHSPLKKTADFFFTVKNSPGTISKESINALTKSLPLIAGSNKIGVIEIIGEEDLLTLLLILLSPLKTAIFYGQPHQGLVHTIVSERLKEKACLLIKKFIY